MPIEWHEQCLKNIELYLAEKRRALFQHEGEVNRTEHTAFVLREQIAEAKRLRKDGFDPDRFLRSRIGMDKGSAVKQAQQALANAEGEQHEQH